jgi:hypothetical protein
MLFSTVVRAPSLVPLTFFCPVFVLAFDGAVGPSVAVETQDESLNFFVAKSAAM